MSVLRSSGDFTQEDVIRLKNGVERHLPGNRFVCLSDVEIDGVETIPLRHDWDGWWAKMEMFRLGGRCLYLDLDTIITGDLSDIANYRGRLAMLSDLYFPERPASGVMSFASCRWIYEAFKMDPERHMATWRGDQEYLSDIIGDCDRLQRLYPGQIVSYKGKGRERNPDCKDGPPEDARIVCFHGKPRPKQVADKNPDGWVAQIWSEQCRQSA